MHTKRTANIRKKIVILHPEGFQYQDRPAGGYSLHSSSAIRRAPTDRATMCTLWNENEKFNLLIKQISSIVHKMGRT